jgi:hypothetical protein
MFGLHGALISFVRNHPMIGGAMFAVGGVFMIYLSIDGARRFHLYENARQVTGQVVSITEASRVPPRFDITVSWPDGSSNSRSVIRTGPRAAEELKAGDPVKILVSQDGSSVILESQRPEDSPLRLAGIEATPIVFFGIGLSLMGILLALFGARLPQTA